MNENDNVNENEDENEKRFVLSLLERKTIYNVNENQ